ncbi:MAG: hypothetical protein N2Z23_09235, partial [Pyrinomonadaceae bacterium]|nr:hypothetical protein [Pyrinomonadaceae bacterium]
EYFKQALKKKKYFFVIGYSFFDPHINNLFFNELSESIDKFLIIINPKISNDISDDEFEERYKIKNVLKKDSKIKLIEQISNIQQNPIYTELPDFNVKRISSDSFEYIKENTENFISNIDSRLDFVAKLAEGEQKTTKIF